MHYLLWHGSRVHAAQALWACSSLWLCWRQEQHHVPWQPSCSCIPCSLQLGRWVRAAVPCAHTVVLPWQVLEVWRGCHSLLAGKGSQCPQHTWTMVPRPDADTEWSLFVRGKNWERPLCLLLGTIFFGEQIVRIGSMSLILSIRVRNSWWHYTGHSF